MKRLLILWALLALNTPASAWSCGDCATETTQIINHVELASTVSNTAASVAEATKQTMLQTNEYLATVQNLRQLPASVIAQYVGPYQQQLQGYSTILSTVQQLQQTSANASNVLQGYQQTAANMGMSQAQLVTWLAQQSQARSGVYKQKLQDEMNTLQSFESSAAALQSAQTNIPGISGNIEGLAHLSSISSIAAGETMQLRMAVQKQLVEQTQQNLDKQDSENRLRDALEKSRQAAEKSIGQFQKIK